jgi:hypothetical protein
MIDCLSRDQSIMWNDCIDETKKRRKTVVNKKELFYYYNAFTYTSITIIEVFIGFKKNLSHLDTVPSDLFLFPR